MSLTHEYHELVEWINRMKLDRNLSPNHIGKYALIKLRDLPTGFPSRSSDNTMITVPDSSVDFGNTPDTEFFVIRLKDKYAAAALSAYAKAAEQDDDEYANQVFDLATKARSYPNKRKPD